MTTAYNLPPGAKLVATWEPPRRRKSKAELAQMSHDARLFYEIHDAPSMTDQDKQAALELEDAQVRYDTGGDISIVNDRAFYDDGPSDYLNGVED